MYVRNNVTAVCADSFLAKALGALDINPVYNGTFSVCEVIMVYAYFFSFAL